MADIRDEHGNRIQLTDEFGGQVQLTDEHGVPVHLTGVATTVDSTPHAGTTTGFQPNIHSETETHLAPKHAEPVIGTGVEKVVHDGGPLVQHHHPVTGGAEVGKQRIGKHAEPVIGTGVEKVVHDGGPLVQQHHPVTGGAEVGKQRIGRPGTSISSSSEDDGEGGRRKKKGLMQKIKEKLPGHKNKEEEQSPTTTVYTSATKVSVTTPVDDTKPEYVRVEHHEKKAGGFMNKIKDELPGHHSH